MCFSFLIFPFADAEWRKFHFSDGGKRYLSSGQFVTAHKNTLPLRRESRVSASMLIVAVKQVHSDAGFAPVFSYRAEICRSTVRLDRNRQSAISWALLSEEIILENTSHSRSVSPYFAMTASLRSSSDFGKQAAPWVL